MGLRPRYEDIARLAYQLWEERGRPEGSPAIDWERAEAALHIEATRLIETSLSRDEAMAEARLAEEGDVAASAPSSRKRRTAKPSVQKNNKSE